MARINLIHPQASPAKTMASEPHPAACPGGAFPRLLNLYPENGVLRARRAARKIQQSQTTGLRTSANLGPNYGSSETHQAKRLGCLGVWRALDRWWAAFGVAKTTGAQGVVAELYVSQNLADWAKILKPGVPTGIDDASVEETRNDTPSSGKGDVRPHVGDVGIVRACMCEVPRRIGPAGTMALFSVPPPSGPHIERHPRLVDVTGQCGIVRPILPPFTPDVWESGSFAAQPVYATFPSFLPIWTVRQPGSWTVSAKDSNGANQSRVTALKWSASLASDPNASKEVTEGIRIELAASALKGDWCELVRGGTDRLDLSRSASIVLLMDPGVSIEFWESVALELVDSNGRRCRVYDARGDWPSLVRVPNRGKEQPCSASSSVRTWTKVGPQFELVSIPISVRTEMQPQATDLANIKGLRFVCTNVVRRSPGLSVMLMAICAGGRIDGGTTFAASFASSYTQVESPAVELPAGGGASWSALGASLTSPFDLAESTALGYSYSVPVCFPSAADARSGANAWRLYMRPAGDSYAYLMPEEARTLIAWDSSDDRWELAAGPYAGQPLSVEGMATFYVRVDDPLMDAMIVAPDEHVREAPPFQAACYAQNRLWLGSGSRLWVSDHGEPHRFREASRFLDDGSLDDLSGCTHDFSGERILAIHAMDGPLAGTNRIFVLTNRRCYMFDGAKPAVPGAVVGRLGSWSPLASCTHREMLAWASEAGDARAWINGGIMQASDGLVGDWFEPASSGGRLTDPASLCACSDGRKIWFSSDAGVLVFEPEERWWAEASFPERFDCMAFHAGTLAAVGRFGEVFVLETGDPLDDFGTDGLIPVEVRTPLLWSPEVPSLAHGALAIACDDVSAVTVAPTALERDGPQYGGSAQTGWRAWTRVPSESGIASPAIGWRLSAKVRARWGLYGLAAEAHQTLEGS